MMIPRSVLRIAGESPRQVYRGIVLRVVAQAFAVLPFFLTWLALQWLLTDSVSHSDWWGLGIGLLVCLLAQLVFSQWGMMDCFLGTYRLMQAYRVAITDRLRLMPLGFFQQRRDGSLASLLTDDIKRVEDMFTHLIAEVIIGSSVALFFALILLWVDWRLTVSLLITLPVAWLLLQLFKRGLLQQGAQQVDRFSLVSGLLVEYVAGIRILRLFNRCDWMLKRLDSSFEQIRQGSLQVERAGGVGVLLFRLILEMGLVTMLLGAA